MRFLGHIEVESGERWVENDCCWICEGWQKATIKIDPDL
jgi:hypothetical protein